MDIGYLITGLILGLTAGISPGPLMAVLISEILKGNLKNGLIISTIPVITDIPLILITIFILKKFENIEPIISLLYFIGGIILIYFGYKDISTNKIEISDSSEISSFKKGIITNLSNPHPYIFWIFIGVPFMMKGGIVEITAFISGFFTGIVSVKVGIALMVEKGKSIVDSKFYLYLIKISGLILIIFGLWFLYQSIDIYTY